MTGAELRLLPYLATHLSFPEIATRLFISRNTVKTEAVSIYRKLGASSRSQAIERAVEVGLLEAISSHLGQISPRRYDAKTEDSRSDVSWPQWTNTRSTSAGSPCTTTPSSACC
jgi:DNA-binding CsgD family transcriptional regulator